MRRPLSPDPKADQGHRNHVQDALYRTVPRTSEARVVDGVGAVRDGGAGLVQVDLDRRLGDLLVDVVDLPGDLIDLQLHLIELVLQRERLPDRRGLGHEAEQHLAA